VGHEPLEIEDLLEWARWMEFEHAKRHVALDYVTPEIRVSTVFLGLDHDFSFAGPPILFETMVFGGGLDGQQEHYATWDEAEYGHGLMLAKVKADVRIFAADRRN
jgi:hypothetical protein